MNIAVAAPVVVSEEEEAAAVPCVCCPLLFPDEGACAEHVRRVHSLLSMSDDDGEDSVDDSVMSTSVDSAIIDAILNDGGFPNYEFENGISMLLNDDDDWPLEEQEEDLLTGKKL